MEGRSPRRGYCPALRHWRRGHREWLKNGARRAKWLEFWGNAVVFFDVLAQRANRTFLLSNGEFQFFVKAVDTVDILRAEELKQQRGYLREIAEDVFHFGMETVIFGAVDHSVSLPKQPEPIERQNASGGHTNNEEGASKLTGNLVETDQRFGLSVYGKDVDQPWIGPDGSLSGLCRFLACRVTGSLACGKALR